MNERHNVYVYAHLQYFCTYIYTHIYITIYRLPPDHIQEAFSLGSSAGVIHVYIFLKHCSAVRAHAGQLGDEDWAPRNFHKKY